MPSNFDCLGLEVTDEDELWTLVDRALPAAVPLRHRPELRRWQDPSGARILFELTDDRRLRGMLPTYAGSPGALLADVEALSDEVAVADVVDGGGGETITRLAVRLEQHRLLGASVVPAAGPASIVALGLDVRAHDSAAGYAASDDSLLTEDEDRSEATEEEPLRMAAESLLCFGLFAHPAEADSYARLAGTVLAVAHRRVALTGGTFTVVRLRTVGMELDLCLPGPDPGPVVGGVVSGTVLLTGSLPGLEHPA
jgi:hypothetical protein